MKNAPWNCTVRLARRLGVSALLVGCVVGGAHAGLVTFSDIVPWTDTTIPSNYDPQMVAADPSGAGAALPTGVTATWPSSLATSSSADDHTPNNADRNTPKNRYLWINTTGTAAIQFSADVQVPNLYIRPDGNAAGSIGVRGKDATGTVVWSATSVGFANVAWNAVTAGAGIAIRSLEFYDGNGGSSGNPRYAGVDDITVSDAAPPGGVPTLASPTVTFVGATEATLGATVTSDGGKTVTDRGTVWNTTTTPTANAASQGTSTGTFTHVRSGLPAGTEIYYRGYASNSVGIAYSAQDSFFTEPATSASGVGFANVTGDSLRITWSNGSGSGRLVLVKAGSAVDADPADFTEYTADAAFPNGSQLGTGNYVVYRGTGSSVDVTGLAGSTVYHVKVYEFAGSGAGTSGINYQQDAPAVGNQTTAEAPVVRQTLVTFSDRPGGDGAIPTNYGPRTVASDPLGAGSALPTGITVVWPGSPLQTSDSAPDHTPNNPNSTTPPNRYLWVNTTGSASVQFSDTVQVPSLWVRPDGNADGGIGVRGLSATDEVVWSITSVGFANGEWNEVTAGAGLLIRKLQFFAGDSGNARYAGIDDIRLVVPGPTATLILLK